jgi:hypothetical protein
VPDADADRADLVLAAAAAVDPDADPARPPLALHIEAGQGGDHPVLELADKGSDVAAVPLQVQHHIGDPLPRPVPGVLAAAPGCVDGQAGGVDQVARLGRGAGRVERRMLQQPHHLRGGIRPDGGHPLLHGRQGGRVVDPLVAGPPLQAG